jgi:hypothetical protein
MQKIRNWWKMRTIPRYTKSTKNLTLVALILAYGGWSTSNGNNPAMIFDKNLAALLDMSPDKRDYVAIRAYVLRTYPNAQLESEGLMYLRWIPKDAEFVIGIELQSGVSTNEFVVYRNKRDWIRA